MVDVIFHFVIGSATQFEIVVIFVMLIHKHQPFEGHPSNFMVGVPQQAMPNEIQPRKVNLCGFVFVDYSFFDSPSAFTDATVIS